MVPTHVAGLKTTCPSAYHHWSCEFESCSWRGVLDTQLYDKVTTGWWFSPGTPPPVKQTATIYVNIVESGVKH
jgi:hypothetical protein